MAGVVSVNVPVAAWPLTSVAVTADPLAPTGTLNVQLNAPVALVVKEPMLQLVIVTLSKTSNPSAFETENPVPDTVTVAPNGPCMGFTVIMGIVMVNGSAVVSVSVAVSFPTTE
jgi:hypothetical protein